MKILNQQIKQEEFFKPDLLWWCQLLEVWGYNLIVIIVNGIDTNNTVTKEKSYNAIFSHVLYIYI